MDLGYPISHFLNIQGKDQKQRFHLQKSANDLTEMELYFRKSKTQDKYCPDTEVS